MSTNDIEIHEGSSITLDFLVKVDDVLTDSDDFEVATIAPSGAQVVYIFDGADNSIVNPSTGLYEFTSNPTDETGVWSVESTAKWNVTGRVPTNDLVETVDIQVVPVKRT